MDLDLAKVREIVERALAEDIGAGDITTRLTTPESAMVSGAIIAKEPAVIAGLPVAEICFQLVDARQRFSRLVEDGARVSKGQRVALLNGPAAAALTSERVALNFLQRMSGIATRTAAFVKLVQGTRARIVDTRKTTPGLRILEKYAVRMGGGSNHRFGLDDGILIKDNHIVAAGGVTAAVNAAKVGAPAGLKVEAEVRSMAELEEAIASAADVVLLDNMSIAEMRAAVEFVNHRAEVEASGGVNEKTVADIAATGVDIISVGALTHSVKAIDLSLELSGPENPE